MGLNKKRFNWKARENRKVVIDNTSANKIKLDSLEISGKYDDCNQFALPSQKRPTKKVKDGKQPDRLLSKKQRKRLEKVTEKKKKKAHRSSLLEALAQVQAPKEELDKLVSVAAVQTKGLKRHFIELENKDFEQCLAGNISQSETAVNSLGGSKRKKRILRAILSKNKKEEVINDPNIVGFEDSASSIESDDDIDVDENKESEKNTYNQCVTEDATIIEAKPVNEYEECNIKEEVIIKNEVETENEFLPEKSQISVSDNNSKADKVMNSIPSKNVKYTPAVYVSVMRDPNVQEARLKLPVLAVEQEIMEAINDHDVVIIAGETGSGKTTQVPQFLYEAGYSRDGKMIGVTQPRRVAAISMAKRVAEEMNVNSNEVSYLIRFEGNVTPQTKIKYMTDGVLLKEIQSDFTLSKYSVILLDEAHERSVYTDILIGLLSRIAPLRKKKGNPLKLVIMSATLRVEDFTENTRLFKTPPPVIKVESRQYPVSVHFNRRTATEFLKECFSKACKIHTRLPEGGILIFVTGQQEVKTLVRRLKKAYPHKSNKKMEEKKVETDNEDIESKIKRLKDRRVPKVEVKDVNLDKYSVVPTDDTEMDLLSDEDDEYLNNLDDFEHPAGISKVSYQPLWVLPLYSLLPSGKQAKVFAKPPDGTRLCVVATNVAETSLTIPNIKYVIDSGKTKRKMYDKTTGVTSFEITWCSKASANQRAGRAGRVGPGHCYRLYSSAVFNDEFPEFTEPEIKEKPVDDLVLQMKAMNIVKVINFPFPTRPDFLQLRAAEKRLKILGALENDPTKEWCARLTKLGETMASFPISPRYAKMLALSCQYDLMQYVICIVAALSVQEVLLGSNGNDKWSKFHRNWAGRGNALLLGDIMVLLRAVGAAEYAKEELEEFCDKSGLRHKAIVEIRKLRVQLTNQINMNVPGFDLVIDPNMKPPTDTQAKLLRQIILSAMGDHVARRVNLDEIPEGQDKMKWKRAYKDAEMEEPVFLHSASVLKKEMPEWVVYQEVYETTKMYMRGVTAIEPDWLPVYAPNLCNLSEPLNEPPPRFDKVTGKVHCHVNGTFGRGALPLPTIEIPYTNTLDSYKWFSVFFLSGDVFPKLKKYVPSLLSAPSCMTKSWARLQPRTEKLLKALLSKEANTRQQLLKVWKEDPYYLLDAYKSWLPESAHESITLIWPPVSKELKDGCV